MKYVNNWLQKLTGSFANGAGLPVSDDALSRLSMVVGDTVFLTLTNTLDVSAAPTYEIISVTKTDNGMSISRGLEGTSITEWAKDDYVYAGVTAGMLEQLGGGSSGGQTGYTRESNKTAGTYPLPATTVFVEQYIGEDYIGGDVIYEIKDDPLCLDIRLSTGATPGNKFILRYLTGNPAYDVAMRGLSGDVTSSTVSASQSSTGTAEIAISSGSNKNLVIHLVSGNSTLVAVAIAEWA